MNQTNTDSFFFHCSHLSRHLTRPLRTLRFQLACGYMPKMPTIYAKFRKNFRPSGAFLPCAGLVLKKFVANFGWHLLAKCEFTPPQSLNPISDFRKPSTNFQTASRNRIWWVSTSKLCACVGTILLGLCRFRKKTACISILGTAQRLRSYDKERNSVRSISRVDRMLGHSLFIETNFFSLFDFRVVKKKFSTVFFLKFLFSNFFFFVYLL